MKTNQQVTRLKCLAVAAVVILSGLTSTATATATATGSLAVTDSPAASTAAAKGVVRPALKPCVDQAVAQGIQQWVCTAEGMDIQKNAAGKKVSEFVAVKPANVTESPGNALLMKREAAASTPASTSVPGEVTILADDYDYWCENGSICTRNITPYISEVKGNAAYGNGAGVIGSFDSVLRVSMSGRRANGVSTIIWDSGPSLFMHSSTYNCYEVGLGSCGKHTMNDRVVNSGSWRKASGQLRGNVLVNNKNYYNAFKTKFLPTGYQEYTAGTLTTERFFCIASPSECKYYY